jgi:hypothetical protein
MTKQFDAIISEPDRPAFLEEKAQTVVIFIFLENNLRPRCSAALGPGLLSPT